MSATGPLALDEIQALRRVTDLLAEFTDAPDDVSLRVESSERAAVIDVPASTLATLTWMLRRLADEGATPTIDPGAVVSTQRAADLLNVSRPHLVRLLEEGRIPFHRVGTHRRVFMREVLRYRAARDRESFAAMDALANQAHALDLP